MTPSNMAVSLCGSHIIIQHDFSFLAVDLSNKKGSEKMCIMLHSSEDSLDIKYKSISNQNHIIINQL